MQRRHQQLHNVFQLCIAVTFSHALFCVWSSANNFSQVKKIQYNGQCSIMSRSLDKLLHLYILSNYFTH